MPRDQLLEVALEAARSKGTLFAPCWLAMLPYFGCNISGDQIVAAGGNGHSHVHCIIPPTPHSTCNHPPAPAAAARQRSRMALDLKVFLIPFDSLKLTKQIGEARA